MDLDKIKNSWNKLDIPLSTDECAVMDIIKGKATTALMRLIATETLLLFIIIPCLSVPFLIDWILEGVYTLPFPIKAAYILFCMAALFWQAYKRILLKRIDIANVGILDNRKLFLKYKLCIKYEIIVGTILGSLLYFSIVYSWKGKMTDYQFELYCWINVILCTLTILICVLFYKRVYYKHIKKIESSLLEIDNMEKE